VGIGDSEAKPAFARGRIITPGTEHQLGTYGLFPPTVAQQRTLRPATQQFSAKSAEPDLLWISFAELCGGEASQADYEALAGQHGTWVIDGVPAPVGSEQESPAWQRFGTLVEVLYERDVTLFLVGPRFPADLAPIAHRLSELARVESTEEAPVEGISGS
jgi:cell division protein ZapE